MRILVDNGGYDLLNIGDTAMLRVGIGRLAAALPEASFAVLTKFPEKLQQVCPGVTPVPPPNSRDIGYLRHRYESLYGWLPWRLYVCITRWEDRRWIHRKGQRLRPRSGSEILRHLAAADALIATGGGYLNSMFEEHANFVLTLLAAAQRAKKPTLLFGQGIGPLESGDLHRIAAHVLPRVDLICLREKANGHDLLRRLGAEDNRIRITGDDAVEPAFAQRPETLGQLVGLNFRKSYYSGIDSELITSLAETVSTAARALGTQVLPVPVSYFEKEDDGALVIKAFSDPSLLAASDIPPDSTGDYAMAAAGRCRVVVTCSYHAALFALAQGVPVIAVVHSPYYDAKFRGLADLFGEHACRSWYAAYMPTDVLKNWIQEQWDDAPQLRAPLLKEASAQIHAGHNSYNEAAELLRCRLSGQTNG